MIKKKNIHFNKYADFLGKKLSANVENTKYYIQGDEIKEGEPDIMYQSFVVIKDVKKFWTHGALYDFIQREENEESEKVITEALLDLNGQLEDTNEYIGDLGSRVGEASLQASDALQRAQAAQNSIADLQGLEGSSSDAQLLASLVVRLNDLETRRPEVKEFDEATWNILTKGGTDLSVSENAICLVFEDTPDTSSSVFKTSGALELSGVLDTSGKLILPGSTIDSNGKLMI